MQGLTANERHVELGRRIHLISARTGLTDTSIFQWGVLWRAKVLLQSLSQ